MSPKLIAVLLAIGCSFLGAAGQIFFKLGSEQLTFNIFEQMTNYKLMIGLVFYGIATIGYVFALKQANVSMLYPIMALSYVWVIIMATIFLKEPFQTYKLIGIAGLFLSISIISW
jgi:uncharacterized membrane protein